MGAKGKTMGAAGKAAQGAPQPTWATQASSTLAMFKPAPTKKQIRKSERKAAYTATHQNTPAEVAPASNFEEELKKRRKNPAGGSIGGDGTYGGNTNLG